ncbi:MAG: hypothetical protein J7J86_07630 [Bacteroidales bacterium]|nr:hypothetical protein [Bacteroidales bacterium]
MKKNKPIKIALISFLLVLFSLNLSAQINFDSPYSRFGIGDIQNNSNTYNASIGGLGIAIKNPNFVNSLNPASYTAFDSVSFVFQGGISFNLVQLKTTTLSVKSNHITLNHLLFGFPITRWWKGSFGLVPFSNVGYKINTFKTYDEIGEIEYLYKGTGGINKCFIGNAFKIYKNLSVGFNTSYLFGTINKYNDVFFPDTSNFFNTRIEKSIIYKGFYFNFGLQYEKTIKKDFLLSTGIIYSNSTNINASKSELAETFLYGGNDVVLVKDTINYVSNCDGNVKLPTSYGIGFAFSKKDKWMVGIDYKFQNWGKYKSYNSSDSLENSMQLSVGMEFFPDKRDYSKYWRTVGYRFGFKYSNTYLELNNNQLNDIALSVGLGFPIKRSKSTINVAAEIGKRGTTADNLIRENYFKISLSFAIYENWFYKRKFD